MKSVDKNDVDISVLFNWSQPLEIKDNHNKVVLTVQQRVVSDAELNQSRVIALRRSSEHRNKLLTEGTNERIALVPQKETLEKESLIMATLSFVLKDLHREVLNEVLVPFPREPSSDASLDEHETYQKEVDNWSAKRTDKIRASVEEKSLQKEKELRKWSFDKLYDTYVRLLVDRECEMIFYDTFNAHLAYLSTYIDLRLKKRAFASFDQFNQLPTRIRNQFVEAYQRLDIDMDELKK